MRVGMFKDNDMALLEMVDEGMKVGEIKAAASVVAALRECVRMGSEGVSAASTYELVLPFDHGESVDNGAAVAVYRRGHLAKLELVGAAEGF